MHRRSQTILVVDDVEHQLNLLFQILTQHGYRVLIAQTGQYILEQVNLAPPDLILLDVMMPYPNGFEVCKLLKANPSTSDIPVIFMTALSDSTDEIKGLELGAVDYIRKPFQPKILLARVKTHLALRQARQQLRLQNGRLQQEIAQRQQFETELRNSEQMYRHLNEVLEQRINERTQSLQTSEIRFQRVINSINDHIYMTIVQDDGTITNQFISPNVVDLTGYPPEKFIDDWEFWSAQVIHPDDRLLTHRYFQQLISGLGQNNELEYRLVRVDGKVIWVRDSASVELNDVSKTIYGVISDITQRKQAEVEKEKQRQLLQKRSRILENLNVLSASVNKAQTRQQVAQAILIANMSITQASGGILYLVDDKNLRPVIGQKLNQMLIAQITKQLTGQPQTLIALETLTFVDELAALPPEASPLHTALLIPVKTTNATVALVYLAFTSSFQLSDELETLLAAVSEIGGNALQRNMVMETLEQRVADRTRELAALYDVTVLAGGTHGLSSALQNALPKIIEAGQCQATAIHLLANDQPALFLTAHQGFTDAAALAMKNIPITADWLDTWLQKPLLAPELAENDQVLPALKLASFQSYLQVPMRIKGNAVGFLSLFWHARYFLALEEVVLLSTIADQLGGAVEIARLRQRIAGIAVQEERQRLVRELHDLVTQSIYSQTLLARTAQDALEDDQPDKLAATLNRLSENALNLLKEMRLLLYELRPAILEQEGLIKALNVRLNAVERHSGMQVSCRLPKHVDLPANVEISLYRIIIEALNNILKHAAAQTVNVLLETVDDQITLIIEDDGSGFDLNQIGEGGIGLRSMRERAELFGGSLTITSAPGQGTTITCQMRIS